MPVPYTFGTATAAIPLSQLDSNFATAITLGNTAVYLGNTTTSIGNLTLTNVTISSGEVTTGNASVSGNVTLTGGTANGVAYLNGSKVLTTGSALVFDGTNLGVGVTPSAWFSTYKGFDVNAWGGLGASSTLVGLYGNAYFSSGANYKYKTTAAASMYLQDGTHSWHVAASGTAGNAITFTQAMTLDASGRLGIGTTSPTTVLHTSSSIAGIFAQGTSTKTNNYLMTCSNSYNYGVVGVVSGDNTSGGDIYALGYVSSAGGSFNPVASWTSSGNLLVGTTSAANASRIVSQYPGNTTLGFTLIDTTAAGGTAVRFYTNTTGFVGSITTSASATAFNTSSDYRLKENVAPMTGALAKVLELNPVTYTWKSDGSDGQGFIAHELQEVYPDAVSGEKDGEQMQGVDYGKLTPILTAALQEAITKIETLEARIAVLEAK